MPYLVSKDGQQFGPFELDELRRYVQEGSILLTDHCSVAGFPAQGHHAAANEVS
jgi:hypothetical protein